MTDNRRKSLPEEPPEVLCSIIMTLVERVGGAVVIPYSELIKARNITHGIVSDLMIIRSLDSCPVNEEAAGLGKESHESH